MTVIALHVHEYADLPLFSDQPQHEVDAWSREFLRRYWPHPELVTLETRVGVPGEHVLRVARDAGVDMVALGWSQNARGRSRGRRPRCARRKPDPVLLVPIEAEAEDDPVDDPVLVAAV